MAFAEPITTDDLRRLELFSSLSGRALDELLRMGSVRRVPARQRLSTAIRDATEHYCFVLEGLVAITLETDVTSEARSGHDDRGAHVEYLGCFGPGACFSDGFLSMATPAGAGIDCVASSPTALLEIGSARLRKLLVSHPGWSAQLTRHIEACRQHFVSQQEPARRVVQDFFFRHGFATTSLVRVGQLDRCLDCNKCHDACAERHGAARMVRFGPRLGRLAFPVVCRNCRDRPCLEACGFGALYFDETTQDVRVGRSCTGCGCCVQRCPNHAISLIQTPYTLADFPDPVPASSPEGATNVDGLLVAGDVAGAALIRLSLNEAVRAVDGIGLRQSPRDPRIVDLAIVGGGPAGLAAALRCRERGLSCCVLEKDRLASTIHDYPKHKHVMAEPKGVPLASSLWFDDCTKEELVLRWQQIARDQNLSILEGAEVRRIERDGGLFRLETECGWVAAERVLICIGKRGSPRRLELAGEAHPRVRYLLNDPEEFAGQHLLVVGGGDSALEAAVSLAETPGTHVTLSYRQAAFTRAKAQNRQRLEALRADGAVRVELKSTVMALEPRCVVLSTALGEQRIENDVVLALLGADPPTRFLEEAGIRVLTPGSPEMAEYAASRGLRQRAVKCDHCAGFPDRACLNACPMGGILELRPEDVFMETGASAESGVPHFSSAPFLEGTRETSPPERRRRVLGALLIGSMMLTLAGIGVECWLRRVMPTASLSSARLAWAGVEEVVTYRSGRGLGHWLGYIGTALMLASLLYSLRTRTRWFEHWGRRPTWLSWHLWIGFAGAVLVTYHSALKLDRWASIACYLMWGVIMTGALGRYVYGKVQSGVSVAEFELRSLAADAGRLKEYARYSRSVGWLLGEQQLGLDRPPRLWAMLWDELRDRCLLLWLRITGIPGISDRKARRELLHALSRWASGRRDRAHFQQAEATLRHWNIAHIVLAILMFLLAGIHVVYGFSYKAF